MYHKNVEIMGNLIYWENHTDQNVVATAYHNAVKIRFYGIACPAHGNATPYLPKYQSYEYTIRFYDEKDKKILAEYQYICVEKQSFMACLDKDNCGKFKIYVYPISDTPGHPRPIYVVAHRCNNIGDLNKVINLRNANAVECDVRCNSDGSEWILNHDTYTPATSASLKDWLNEALKIDKLCLIYFDIKDQGYADKLHKYVNENFIQRHDKPIWILYSVNTVKNASKFKCFVGSLKYWEGMCIDYEKEPQKVQDFFRYIGATRYWYANGIYAGALDSESLRQSLLAAGKLRDSESGGICKTLIWTIEKTETASEYLYNERVDAVITNAGGGDVPRNYIDNILKVIEHSRTLRMANHADNPFEVFKSK